MMQPEQLLSFLTAAGTLKQTLRHCYTAPERRESVADHSWRLALMAYLCADEYEGIDLSRLLVFCLVHDLGEAVTGDIPAFDKTQTDEKTEDAAIAALLDTLPEPVRGRLKTLFVEYAAQNSDEARLCLALDKLEALHSHNEAPLDTWLPLEYDLQMTYGEREAAFSPYTAELRAVLNEATRRKVAAGREGTDAPPHSAFAHSKSKAD